MNHLRTLFWSQAVVRIVLPFNLLLSLCSASTSSWFRAAFCLWLISLATC